MICSVSTYICVYSVNMCGVSSWVAVWIFFFFRPVDDYGVVSGTGGFMRMTRLDSRARGSLLREAGKKTENQGKITENN